MLFLLQMLALESNNRILKEELIRVRQPLIAFEQHDENMELQHQSDIACAIDMDSKVRSDLAHSVADVEDFKIR
jgi:hypothetical protein